MRMLAVSTTVVVPGWKLHHQHTLTETIAIVVILAEAGHWHFVKRVVETEPKPQTRLMSRRTGTYNTHKMKV